MSHGRRAFSFDNASNDFQARNNVSCMTSPARLRSRHNQQRKPNKSACKGAHSDSNRCRSFCARLPINAIDRPTEEFIEGTDWPFALRLLAEPFSVGRWTGILQDCRRTPQAGEASSVFTPTTKTQGDG